jgi:aerobic carbon-monoxide dehydrogenase small subunit
MSFSLNGQAVTLTCPPQTLLVEALRLCGLSGTPVGCDTAQCGACTVLVDGQATKSCNLLAAQVTGCAVTTVEGLDHTSNTLPTYCGACSHSTTPCNAASAPAAC